MTPMIDVVFLLLIFFVCAAAGQVREFFLATELAPGSISAAEAEAVERPLGELWIHLRRDDRGRTIVEFNEPPRGRRFDGEDRFAEVRRYLMELAELGREELPVILDIDKRVPIEDVVKVYDACRAADFASIHFAIEAAPEAS